MRALYRAGGLALVASGAAFLADSALELWMGRPPTSGAEILIWIAAHRMPMAFVPETLFFAALFLIPGVIALYQSLATAHRAHAVAGCGILAVTIPILYALITLHGRIAYPVFQIGVHTPDIAELVVAVYYGGLHTIGLLFAIATFVLSLAMRRGPYGAGVVYLGFAAALADLIGAYPWAITPVAWFITGVIFSTWWVVVGLKLYRMPEHVHVHLARGDV